MNVTQYRITDTSEIDRWLIDQVGYGNWSEWLSITPRPVPYRSFSFKNSKHETLFLLTWAHLILSEPNTTSNQ